MALTASHIEIKNLPLIVLNAHNHNHFQHHIFSILSLNYSRCSSMQRGKEYIDSVQKQYRWEKYFCSKNISTVRRTRSSIVFHEEQPSWKISFPLPGELLREQR